MLGDKDFLHPHKGQKTSFMNEVQQSRFNQIIEEKDNEIKALKKTIKRLTKELKQKGQSPQFQTGAQGPHTHLKNVLQREINKNIELRQTIANLTERIKKFTQQVNQEFTLSQNSQQMENLMKMLQIGNKSGSRQEMSSLQSRQQGSSQHSQEQLQIQKTMEDFQIIMRGLSSKYIQTNKIYKQSLQIQKQIQEQLTGYKKQLKSQKKSKDLLQKLLQTSQTQKNQLVNQINCIANHKQMQELKQKTKQEVIMYSFKLNYRIKDLEKEKQEYLKSSTRDKQKQMKLYEALLGQVKGIKQRSRLRQSVA